MWFVYLLSLLSTLFQDIKVIAEPQNFDFFFPILGKGIQPQGFIYQPRWTGMHGTKDAKEVPRFNLEEGLE